MTPDQLTVVTAISNPALWKSRVRLYREFEQRMLDSGVKLVTVELTYGDMSPEALPCSPYVTHVHVRADGLHKMWVKECLLNIGIARAWDAKYIATVDADVTFRDQDWARDTLHALQHYSIIQPWSWSYDLGPNGEHVQVQRSFASILYSDGPEAINQGPGAPKRIGYISKYGHTGYAWAWRRQALEWAGGLFEDAVLGSADHHMALAMIGKVEWSIPRWLVGPYREELLLWQHRLFPHIGGHIGRLPGTIEHHFHGNKAKRAYVDRWEIIKRNHFNPRVDLKRNTYGVLELAGNKPQLSHDIDAYFRSRDEDANTLG